MPPTVRAILVTPDADRLAGYYTALLGATQTDRQPEEGPVFYLGLAVGDSALGIVADGSVPTGTPGRVVLSIEMDDVAALAPRVAELGGRVTGGPNDMPWGQRVLHTEDPDGNVVNLTQEL